LRNAPSSRIVRSLAHSKSILFSAIARPRFASRHLSLGLSRRRMAKRVTVDVRPDRVAASKTGYGESTKERTIARARARAPPHNAAARRETGRQCGGSACTPVRCVPRRKGNRNAPAAITSARVKSSRRMHVHGYTCGRGTRAARTSALRETPRNASLPLSPPPSPLCLFHRRYRTRAARAITKSGTISWEPAAKDGGLRNSTVAAAELRARADCDASESALATRDSRPVARGCRGCRGCGDGESEMSDSDY